MPDDIFGDLSERERDALVVATAADEDVLMLCSDLGEDPSKVAEQVRQLLLGSLSIQPGENIQLNRLRERIKPLLAGAQTPAPKSEDLHLSELVRSLRSLAADSPERQARIESIARAYANGSYQVDVVDRMPHGRIDRNLKPRRQVDRSLKAQKPWPNAWGDA
jgi:hypothetical protein